MTGHCFKFFNYILPWQNLLNSKDDVGGMGEWCGSIKFWRGPKKKKNGVGSMDRNFVVAGVGP